MLLSLFIGVLTVVLVLDCLFLLLLILIQLPKKEAGLGQAFGSGTTDALFGAGTGSALTKMTKYSAVVFFVIVLVLAMLNAHATKAQRGGNLREALRKANEAAAQQAAPATTPGASNAPVKVTPEAPLKINLNAPTNAVVAPAVPATNVPVKIAVTNVPAKPAATNTTSAPK